MTSVAARDERKKKTEFEKQARLKRCHPSLPSSQQTTFIGSMAVAFLDIHPTLYVVSPLWNRLGSVLYGPQRTGLALPSTTYRWDDCQKMLLSCFRKRMSASQQGRRPWFCYGQTSKDCPTQSSALLPSSRRHKRLKAKSLHPLAFPPPESSVGHEEVG